MYKGKRVTVIAPCFNEELKIGKVIDRVQTLGWVDEVLVVDDGSTDQSADVSKRKGARVLSMGRLVGVGAALRAGMREAQKDSDILVIIAGNNKDEPQEIPRLLDPILEDRADFVQGSRFLVGGGYGGEMPAYRKLATRLHPWLFSLVSGRRVTESTNGFRAFRSSVLNDPKLNLDQAWLDQYELEPYFYYRVIKLGYRTLEVPVTKIYPPKKMGYTKMTPVIGWWSILRPLVYLGLGLRK